MFKFTGIKKEKEENTDNAITNIVRKGGDGYLINQSYMYPLYAF